jgi:hypothetical protein
MKVLIACERSGVVRRAFMARGYDVWSCDVEAADDGSNRHIRGDIRDVMHDGWDLMTVMHPPCTRLCNSGVRWLHQPPSGKTLDEMWAELDIACALFSACLNAPIPCVAVENPVMHLHAKARIAGYQPPAQTVQPWWFGDEAFKATSFYLRNLPSLVATKRLTLPKVGTDAHKKWSAIHRASPSQGRAKFRSQSFPGIADAMAQQWGAAAVKHLQ